MRHPTFTRRLQRKTRIRARMTGTALRPRMTVYRSHTQITVQIIDDAAGRTLVFGSTKEVKGKSNKEGAQKLGTLVAKKALEKKISSVVFDRNAYKYHGAVKELADAARAAGLQF